jgi:gliding motility-associated-like protein
LLLFAIIKMNRFPYKFIVIILLQGFVNILFAQKQNNQWRFGFGAAIDFNTVPPTFPSGTALPTLDPPFQTGSYIEGTASVADRYTGELLFYTDGQTVWNALNQPMPNGTDLAGSTFLSAIAGAIIVPVPQSCSRYYIFTAGDYEEGFEGFKYSVVDMALNNDLGDVVQGQKGIFWYQNESEAVMAYPNNNQSGYWVFTSGNQDSTMAAFSVTANGIAAAPVVSQINGRALNFKINPQGTKLVVTNESFTLDLYDVNMQTGQLTNPVNIALSVPGGDQLKYFEFSPNGQYLYGTSDYFFYQLDISSNNATSILASATVLTNPIPGAMYGTPQLGPDGKLYVVISPLVYVLDNPNSPASQIGALSFLSDSIGTMVCLPQWIHVLPMSTNAEITVTGDLCADEALTFSVNPMADVLTVSWDFGDPNSETNSSNEIQPSHTYISPGNYEISAVVETSCGTDTIKYTLLLTNCSPTTNSEPVIPNVITPNGDGTNDFFEIQNLPENTEVIILNRWGNLVFTSDNYQNNFDGKDISGSELIEGVYTYYYKTLNGKSGHGFVHLVR